MWSIHWRWQPCKENKVAESSAEAELCVLTAAYKIGRIFDFWFKKPWPTTSFSTWGATTKPQSQCLKTLAGPSRRTRYQGSRQNQPSWLMSIQMINWLTCWQSQPQYLWMIGSIRCGVWFLEMVRQISGREAVKCHDKKWGSKVQCQKWVRDIDATELYNKNCCKVSVISGTTWRPF